MESIYVCVYIRICQLILGNGVHILTYFLNDKHIFNMIYTIKSNFISFEDDNSAVVKQ